MSPNDVIDEKVTPIFFKSHKTGSNEGRYILISATFFLSILIFQFPFTLKMELLFLFYRGSNWERFSVM